ncbi:polyprenol monophosphomannose synthase [Brachybacterium sp. JHP9]|uniref:Polyprenol monophosphomannose synthase n=1 Tax=Brachybacterium equifaecis TaxID=2910770 RepID=A0ABT0R2G7_9MICO|nr:polyprenol monophosphomannose synthase [Brachybacterium equifaecis]MCL6424126.1 polyprenol monophosphomannose synthase [Brachybacterium equifaecis]
MSPAERGAGVPHPSSAAPERTLVVIPTYNEIDALPPTLARLRAAVPHAHVLIVDDASPDGTGDFAAQQSAQDPQVHVLHRAGKEGLGPAYLAGFAWGLAEGFEVLVEMDADASHRPEQLERLLEGVRRGADLVIGSRWVSGGAVHNWPLRRLLLSRGANIYTKIMIGMPARDATAGFRAYRAPLLARLLQESPASQGYCFQVDMTRLADRHGALIREVPIDFDERTEGASKMSSSIVQEALVKVTLWGIAHRAQQAATVVRYPRSTGGRDRAARRSARSAR